MYHIHVAHAGDGNCGYRAVGLGLVVAIAGLQPVVRQQFAQHLEHLWFGMQHFPKMLTCHSPSQGSVEMGYLALLVRLASTLLHTMRMLQTCCDVPQAHVQMVYLNMCKCQKQLLPYAL